MAGFEQEGEAGRKDGKEERGGGSWRREESRRKKKEEDWKEKAGTQQCKGEGKEREVGEDLLT